LIPFANGRNAVTGFVSSIVSDTVANFMRVVKTTKQALAARGDDEEYGSTGISAARVVKKVTYTETIGVILAADGWRGLFGRGLKTRIFANAIQSIVFTVIWRGLSDKWSNKDKIDDNVILVTPNSGNESENGNENYIRNGDSVEESK